MSSPALLRQSLWKRLRSSALTRSSDAVDQPVYRHSATQLRRAAEDEPHAEDHGRSARLAELGLGLSLGLGLGLG